MAEAISRTVVREVGKLYKMSSSMRELLYIQEGIVRVTGIYKAHEVEMQRIEDWYDIHDVTIPEIIEPWVEFEYIDDPNEIKFMFPVQTFVDHTSIIC